MEDIPKNLEKELTRLTGTQSRKKNRHWMLLFVNERGKIIAIRRFRGLMFLWVSLLIVAASVSAGLYFLYDWTGRENLRLRQALSFSTSRIKVLKSDYEELSVRLVAAESRLKAMLPAVRNQPAPEDGAEAVPSAEAVSEGADEKGIPDATVTVDMETEGGSLSGSANLPEAEDRPAPEVNLRAIAQTASQQKPSKVDVESFRAVLNPEDSRFHVQFKIKNAASDSTTVSGYTFVMFTEKEGEIDDALVFPKAKISEGKPFPIKSGRHFSIQRFKTVRFETQEIPSPNKIKAAIVRVYDIGGELMMEKTFGLNGDTAKDTDTEG